MHCFLFVFLSLSQSFSNLFFPSSVFLFHSFYVEYALVRKFGSLIALCCSCLRNPSLFILLCVLFVVVSVISSFIPLYLFLHSTQLFSAMRFYCFTLTIVSNNTIFSIIIYFFFSLLFPFFPFIQMIPSTEQQATWANRALCLRMRSFHSSCKGNFQVVGILFFIFLISVFLLFSLSLIRIMCCGWFASFSHFFLKEFYMIF